MMTIADLAQGYRLANRDILQNVVLDRGDSLRFQALGDVVFDFMYGSRKGHESVKKLSIVHKTTSSSTIANSLSKNNYHLTTN
ncbi:hypothetical protein D1872_247290 [compost metagenome]